MVLILVFTFFQFYSVVSWESKVNNFSHSLFLLIIIRSGLLVGIKWSVCMSKSHRSLCVSFSRTGAGLCIYHLLVISVSCSYPSGSPWRPSRVSPYISSVLIFCIHLSCDWSFCLCFTIIIIIIVYCFRVFHISISWWFFTEVWVTASLLKSPGIVSVFWPSSAMQSFG